MADMSKPDKSLVYAKTRLGANGRIVIPSAIREALNLKPGEMLSLEVADGILRVESFEQKLRRLQDEVIGMVGRERSLADELIAERREEARREQEEADRERCGEANSLRKAG